MKTSIIYDNKHMTLSNRIVIEKLLNEGKNFVKISNEIGKTNRTISYEIKKHREKKQGLMINNRSYTDCPKTSKPPYVCNSCTSRKGCKKTKFLYIAENANMNYKDTLSNSRKGIDMSNDDFINMNKIISDDIKKGHSFYMICNNHDFPVKERTLYNYVEKGYLDIINHDLPRKVRYKKRNRKTNNEIRSTKHRIGRTYEIFSRFISDNPNLEIVEMDTVIGNVGTLENVLLTLLWRKSNLLLAFKLTDKTSNAVTEIFKKIKQELGYELFHKYFAIVLTDNGTEFSNPDFIEDNGPDVKRSNVFYCDPRHSEQKGKLEVAHEYIRRYLPKGKSFNDYSQEDINLMINNINNTPRKSLEDNIFNKKDNTPYKLHKNTTDDKFFDTFNLYYIKPTSVILNKSIFNKKDN